MTLSEFLKQRDLTITCFAKMIGVTAPAAWRYCNGERIPRPITMRRIVEVTGGAVQPQDFYSLDTDGEAA